MSFAQIDLGLREIGDNIDTIFTVHPIEPGANQGVGNYVLDPKSADFTDFLLTLHQLRERNCSFLVTGAERCFTCCIECNLNNFYGGSGCPDSTNSLGRKRNAS